MLQQQRRQSSSTSASSEASSACSSFEYDQDAFLTSIINHHQQHQQKAKEAATKTNGKAAGSKHSETSSSSSSTTASQNHPRNQEQQQQQHHLWSESDDLRLAELVAALGPKWKLFHEQYFTTSSVNSISWRWRRIQTALFMLNASQQTLTTPASSSSSSSSLVTITEAIRSLHRNNRNNSNNNNKSSAISSSSSTIGLNISTCSESGNTINGQRRHHHHGRQLVGDDDLATRARNHLLEMARREFVDSSSTSSGAVAVPTKNNIFQGMTLAGSCVLEEFADRARRGYNNNNNDNDNNNTNSNNYNNDVITTLNLGTCWITQEQQNQTYSFPPSKSSSAKSTADSAVDFPCFSTNSISSSLSSGGRRTNFSSSTLLSSNSSPSVASGGSSVDVVSALSLAARFNDGQNDTNPPRNSNNEKSLIESTKTSASSSFDENFRNQLKISVSKSQHDSSLPLTSSSASLLPSFSPYITNQKNSFATNLLWNQQQKNHPNSSTTTATAAAAAAATATNRNRASSSRASSTASLGVGSTSTSIQQHQRQQQQQQQDEMQQRRRGRDFFERDSQHLRQPQQQDAASVNDVAIGGVVESHDGFPSRPDHAPQLQHQKGILQLGWNRGHRHHDHHNHNNHQHPHPHHHHHRDSSASASASSLSSFPKQEMFQNRIAEGVCQALEKTASESLAEDNATKFDDAWRNVSASGVLSANNSWASVAEPQTRASYLSVEAVRRLEREHERMLELQEENARRREHRVLRSLLPNWFESSNRDDGGGSNHNNNSSVMVTKDVLGSSSLSSNTFPRVGVSTSPVLSSRPETTDAHFGYFDNGDTSDQHFFHLHHHHHHQKQQQQQQQQQQCGHREFYRNLHDGDNNRNNNNGTSSDSDLDSDSGNGARRLISSPVVALIRQQQQQQQQQQPSFAEKDDSSPSFGDCYSFDESAALQAVLESVLHVNNNSNNNNNHNNAVDQSSTSIIADDFVDSASNDSREVSTFSSASNEYNDNNNSNSNNSNDNNRRNDNGMISTKTFYAKAISADLVAPARHSYNRKILEKEQEQIRQRREAGDDVDDERLRFREQSRNTSDSASSVSSFFYFPEHYYLEKSKSMFSDGSFPDELHDNPETNNEPFVANHSTEQNPSRGRPLATFSSTISHRINQLWVKKTLEHHHHQLQQQQQQQHGQRQLFAEEASSSIASFFSSLVPRQKDPSAYFFPSYVSPFSPPRSSISSARNNASGRGRDDSNKNNISGNFRNTNTFEDYFLDSWVAPDYRVTNPTCSATAKNKRTPITVSDPLGNSYNSSSRSSTWCDSNIDGATSQHGEQRMINIDDDETSFCCPSFSHCSPPSLSTFHSPLHFRNPFPAFVAPTIFFIDEATGDWTTRGNDPLLPSNHFELCSGTFGKITPSEMVAKRKLMRQLLENQIVVTNQIKSNDFAATVPCAAFTKIMTPPHVASLDELLDARPASTTLDTLEGSQFMCPVLFVKGLFGSFVERLQCPDPAEVLPFLS